MKNLLRSRIVLHGYTITEFVKLINMPRNTSWKKLNGGTEFTLSEIKSICDVLGESPMDIFFIDNVPNQKKKVV